MMKVYQIWEEECEVAVLLEAEFGTERALSYLIGEKFLEFLDAADSDPDFRAEIPAFAAETKAVFEDWQLAEYLERVSQTEPFDFSIDEAKESVEFVNQLDASQSVAELSLLERAKEWLLGEGEYAFQLFNLRS
jgi:hypothetical protein